MVDHDVVEGKLKQAEGKVQDAAADVTGSTEDNWPARQNRLSVKFRKASATPKTPFGIP